MKVKLDSLGFFNMEEIPVAEIEADGKWHKCVVSNKQGIAIGEVWLAVKI